MIRHAHERDIAQIMDIVRSAQEALAELGIDQWQDGYPTREVIAEDIARGVGYVATGSNGAVEGYAAIILDGESAYAQLSDKEWHTPDRYVVTHRICVAAKSRRRGIAQELLKYGEELALANDIKAARIDTHRGNIRMLALLRRLGFEQCGVIHYDSGERVAYDKNLV